ncbi:CocE/NonD family hydrolase [Branchiibius cervicis]|uniref:CocE/NonD family hydrolase n=1 Tax=Branchiibius cervicis TaxID=908252 RepID=A0ABW2AT07_9MICO
MSIILMYALTHFVTQDTYLWEPDWTRRPYIDQLEQFQEEIGLRSPSFDLWYPNPVYLQRFRGGSPFEARPVPVLSTIGWWDNCAPWSWRDHADIARRPAWEHNEFLVIESIDHENYPLGWPGGERTQEALRQMLPAYLDPAVEFFDVFLRGRGTAAQIPKVRWSLAGTEGFRHAAHWPPSQVERVSWWATADGQLSHSDSGPCTRLSWKHDPNDLVPSSVPDPFSFLQHSPDERDLAQRADVVGFAGAPVAEPVNLVGPVRLSLTVESTGPTMDVMARLYDVAPDGRFLRIARGQQTVDDAGVPVRVDLDLGHVGYQLAAGHHLRLHVQSSDFPEFMPQPGTDESPWSAVDVAATTQSVIVGGPDGVRLEMGVLPDPGPACPTVAVGGHRGDDRR